MLTENNDRQEQTNINWKHFIYNIHFEFMRDPLYQNIVAHLYNSISRQKSITENPHFQVLHSWFAAFTIKNKEVLLKIHETKV